MMNPLEENLFQRFKRKKKNSNISIKLLDAILIVSGIREEEILKQERRKIKLFNKQFLAKFNEFPKDQKQRANSILGYMGYRLKEIKKDGSLITKADEFLTKNPFSNIGKTQEIFASWISLCSFQNLEKIELLSDGEKLRGYFNDGEKEYFFNPAKKRFIELKKGHGYKKYSRSAIVPEILTQRAWSRYRAGRFEESIEDCEKALKIVPNYLNSLFCGMVSKKQVGIQENSEIYLKGAVEYFEELIKVKEYGKAYEEMIDVYQALGNTEMVDDCIEKSQDLEGMELKDRLTRKIKQIRSKKSLLGKIFS